MPEPINIVNKNFEPGGFSALLEKKFKSGISYGTHGFSLTKDVKFNTESISVSRFIKGPKTKNLDGQYILVEIPDAAAGTFTNAIIEHDLNRIPVGVSVIEQGGVDKTSYPYILKDVLHGIVLYKDDPQDWNSKKIKLKSSKITGGSFPIRMVLMVF